MSAVKKREDMFTSRPLRGCRGRKFSTRRLPSSSMRVLNFCSCRGECGGEGDGGWGGAQVVGKKGREAVYMSVFLFPMTCSSSRKGYQGTSPSSDIPFELRSHLKEQCYAGMSSYIYIYVFVIELLPLL